MLNEKVLIAKNPLNSSLNIPVQITEYFNQAHETTDIAKQIETLNKNGIALNEIAVLYKNHAQAEEIIAYLKVKKIEVNSRRRMNVLSEPLIKKIIHANIVQG